MPDPLPPPQELTWDSSIKDLLLNSLSFSDELLDAEKPPRFIRMYAERWQVNWQQSGISDPSAQCIVDLTLSARPVAPSTISFKV